MCMEHMETMPCKECSGEGQVERAAPPIDKAIAAEMKSPDEIERLSDALLNTLYTTIPEDMPVATVVGVIEMLKDRFLKEQRELSSGS
jgi:hypothetical protein